MTKNRIFISLAILSLCLVLGWALSRMEEPNRIPGKGDKIPDASFQSLDGNRLSFAALRGKVLVINFWATWCPPCREEMPSLNALFRKMQGQGVEFLAFSADTGKEPVREFLGQGKYSLPVYDDFQRSLAQQFGTYQFPETYLVDKQGIVREKVIGGIDWGVPAMESLLRRLAAE